MPVVVKPSIRSHFRLILSCQWPLPVHQQILSTSPPQYIVTSSTSPSLYYSCQTEEHFSPGPHPCLPNWSPSFTLVNVLCTCLCSLKRNSDQSRPHPCSELSKGWLFALNKVLLSTHIYGSDSSEH